MTSLRRRTSPGNTFKREPFSFLQYGQPHPRLNRTENVCAVKDFLESHPAGLRCRNRLHHAEHGTKGIDMQHMSIYYVPCSNHGKPHNKDAPGSRGQSTATTKVHIETKISVATKIIVATEISTSRNRSRCEFRRSCGGG
jgi:hypothetical protein